MSSDISYLIRIILNKIKIKNKASIFIDIRATKKLNADFFIK